MSSLSSFAIPPSTPPAPPSAPLSRSSPSHPATTTSSSTLDTPDALESHQQGAQQQQQQLKRTPLALNMAAVSPPTPAPSPRPSEAAGLANFTFFSSLEGHSAEDSQASHILSIFNQLPPAARTNLLQALLPLLTTPELLLLSSGISPRLKRDFLRDLPLEISLHILSFVDSPRTLARASCVSKFWRRLLEDEWTWKEMCARHRFAATTSAGAALSSVPIADVPDEDSSTNVQDATEDLTMFGSPRLGIEAPGAPRMSIGGINSPSTFPPPFLAQIGDFSAPPTAGSSSQAAVTTSPSSTVTFSSLPDLFRTGNTSAAHAVHAALEAPSPAAFLAYAISSVGAHAPSGMTNQFPFGMGDEDDAMDDGGSPALGDTSEDEDNDDEPAEHGMGMPLLSPTSFFSSLTNTLGLPYGTSNAAAAAAVVAAAATQEQGGTGSTDLAQPQPQTSPSIRSFLPRSLVGLGNVPSRPASLPSRSVSSPLVGGEGQRSKGKGKEKARRNSSGYQEGDDQTEEERARFSYKRHFKRAYLTESNWLRGGRLLSTHTSTDDGVVTSLAVDDKFIVIGMNNCKIHIFDATSGTFLRTLVGHEAGGVWCLTLISAGGERKEAPPPKEEGDVDMDAGRRVRKFDEGALKTDQVREPVLVGGESSPSATSRPQGLFGGLSDFSANSNPLASSSTTSLPPSFDHHFATSSSNSKLGPDGKPKMAQSDVCGASKGFGQKRTLIVSGGCDRDIRVWDAETGACIYILRGHTSTIRCLTVVEGRPLVVSGSRDSTLRVWDVEKGVLVHLLAGHQHSVRCVEVAGNQVVSGSYDCTCRLWDVDTGECLQVFRGHYHQIYSVAFDGERVATGSLDSTVRVWSAETGDCLALLQGHTSLVGQLQLTNDLLVTGGSDGRVIIFSLSTFECLHRLCAHDNSVTCLQFDDRFIVSGGNDGRVKLWDLRTGAFIRELSKPCEVVWRIAFKDDKCVVLCKRGGKTVMEVLTFRPSEGEL